MFARSASQIGHVKLSGLLAPLNVVAFSSLQYPLSMASSKCLFAAWFVEKMVLQLQHWLLTVATAAKFLR